MLILAWAGLGWLCGLGLEAVAERVAGARSAACPSCGRPEPGRRWPALARLLRSAGPRCRTCGSWALVWLAGLGPALALAFALLADRLPLSAELVATSGYAAVLLLVAVLDLRYHLVYPILTYPATALALVVTPLVLHQPDWSAVAGAGAGAAIFLVLYGLGAALYRGREAMGLGDVMIAGLVGAMVGLPGLLSALILGILLGGLNAAVLAVARRSRDRHFAYGPALCLGGLLTLLAGMAP